MHCRWAPVALTSAAQIQVQVTQRKGPTALLFSQVSFVVCYGSCFKRWLCLVAHTFLFMVSVLYFFCEPPQKIHGLRQGFSPVSSGYNRLLGSINFIHVQSCMFISSCPSCTSRNQIDFEIGVELLGVDSISRVSKKLLRRSVKLSFRPPDVTVGAEIADPNTCTAGQVWWWISNENRVPLFFEWCCKYKLVKQFDEWNVTVHPTVRCGQLFFFLNKFSPSLRDPTSCDPRCRHHFFLGTRWDFQFTPLSGSSILRWPLYVNGLHFGALQVVTKLSHSHPSPFIFVHCPMQNRSIYTSDFICNPIDSAVDFVWNEKWIQRANLCPNWLRTALVFIIIIGTQFHHMWKTSLPSSSSCFILVKQLNNYFHYFPLESVKKTG